MKRFTLSALACAAILTSISLMADPTPAAAPSTTPAAPAAPATPPARAEKPGRHEKMKEVLESLNLTDTQKEQIKKIREDKTLEGKAKHEAMIAVLTPDQKAKFDAAMPPKHKK